MNRIWMIAAAPLLLGGCLPLPVSIVSTAFSGVSYIASGKSTSDHVLSAAVNQDCALTRPIFGDPVCREIGPNGEGATPAVTVAYYPGDQDDWMQSEEREKLEDRGVLDMTTIDEGAAQVAIILPFINSAPKIEDDAVEVTAAAVRPAPGARRVPVAFSSDEWNPPRPTERIAIASLRDAVVPDDAGDGVSNVTGLAESGRYLIIGSFRDIVRAETLAGRHDARAPKILTAKVEGRTWYRVALGPFNAPEMERTKHAMGTVGGVIPWAIKLRAPTLLAQL